MKRELTGRTVLLYLVAFFAVILAVNVYFMAVAVNTFRGEDDLKPYQEGIEYNQTLARRAAQEKLGWKARFDVARIDSQNVHVDVLLTRADGSPETKAALTGEFRHPSDESRDRTLRLMEVRAGEYAADVNGIAPGAWDLIVRTPPNIAPFEASRRMWVP